MIQWLAQKDKVQWKSEENDSIASAAKRDNCWRVGTIGSFSLGPNSENVTSADISTYTFTFCGTARMILMPPVALSFTAVTSWLPEALMSVPTVKTMRLSSRCLSTMSMSWIIQRGWFNASVLLYGCSSLIRVRAVMLVMPFTLRS